MLKFIKKEILIGAIAVFVVLCIITACLYFLLAHPRNIELKGVEGRLAAKQSEYEALSQDTVRHLKEQADKQRTELGGYMILAGHQGELPIRLRQLAAENRLEGFSSKDVSGGILDTELQYISEQRVNISFAGDFTGFAGFLRAIESNNPAVFVDSFNVTHDSKDDTRITASMESTVYVEQKVKK